MRVDHCSGMDADLAIRNDEGEPVYRVNARRTDDGTFVVEPRPLVNPLHTALVRKLGAAEKMPLSIEAACLAELHPEAALARMKVPDLEWIMNSIGRHLELVRCDVDVAITRHPIAEELRAHIVSTAWWESEVVDG